MKKIILALGLMFISTLALTNCTKNEEFNITPEANTPFELFANVESRTTNNGLSTKWAAKDEISVFHAEAGTTAYINDTPYDSASQKGRPFVTEDASGLFKGTITGVLNAAEYDWYVLYPYNSYATSPANTSSGYTYIGGRSDAIQTQTGNNSMTHIAGKNYPLAGVAKNVAAGGRPIITMQHLSSLIEFNVTNSLQEDITINSISFTAPVNIMGTFFINHANEIASFTDGQHVTKTATLSVNGGAAITPGSSAKFYMAVKPFKADNAALKIEVKATSATGNGALTVTKNATTEFVGGKIKTINVNYNAAIEPATAETWTLITNASQIDNGTYVFVAKQKNGSTISYVPNTTASAGSVNQKNTTLFDLTSANVVTNIVPEDARWTVTAASNGFTIKNPSGKYLYTTSTNNGLVVGDTEDTWSFTSHTNNAKAFSIKDSKNSRYLTLFSTSNWRCYTTLYKYSSTTDQNGEIYIYKLDVQTDPNAPSITLAQNTIEVEATETNAETAITLANVEEVDLNVDFDDWIDDAWVEDGMLYINFSANTTTASRSAVITISANGAEAKVTITQKGKAVPAAEITIKEFLAKGVDANVEYILRGTITRVVNTSYGNFDITDETGTVYIYGLVSPDGNTNKYWATSKAKLGDDIIIKTVRADYNGTPQGINAKFVELITPGTLPFYNVDYSVVQLPYTGGNSDVNIAVYNTTATVTATSNNPAITATVNGYKVTISATANETEQTIEGIVTIKVGDLNSTDVNVTIAGKPAEGQVVGGSDDFDTVSTNTSYVKTTTKAGWVAVNCAILSGGDSDASPAFKMIGASTNRAFCMNGKTSAVGTITSPTLNTGCGTLSFNYGLPFSDNKIKFRVDIKQNGSVVKTFTVDKTTATQKTLYSHEEVVNVAGDFQIVFTNLSPSNNTGNKDRTAVWDVEWTGYQN